MYALPYSVHNDWQVVGAQALQPCYARDKVPRRNTSRSKLRPDRVQHEGRLDHAHAVQLRELVTALEIAADDTPEPVAIDDGWRRTLAQISRNAEAVAGGSEDIVQLLFDIGRYTLQNRLDPHHRIPDRPVAGYYDSEGRYVAP